MSWLKFLFSFDGRICRRSFWLHLILPLMALNIVVAVVAPPLELNKYMIILWVASLWPYFAVGAKRCHDRGRSGWFQLIWLIPVVGPFCYANSALPEGRQVPIVSVPRASVRCLDRLPIWSNRPRRRRLTPSGRSRIQRRSFQRSKCRGVPCREAHLSAEQTHPQAPPWLPRPHGHRRRSHRAVAPAGQGTQAPLRLTER